MASSDLVVGEFVPFFGDVEAAVITGEQVEACTSGFNIGTEYRTKEGYERALIEEVGFGLMAQATNNLMDLFVAVEDIELSVRVVVASQSGALALRRYSGEIDASVFNTISALDNSNAIFVGEAEMVTVV